MRACDIVCLKRERRSSISSPYDASSCVCSRRVILLLLFFFAIASYCDVYLTPRSSFVLPQVPTVVCDFGASQSRLSSSLSQEVELAYFACTVGFVCNCVLTVIK